MITKKIWNSLSECRRRSIAEFVFYNMSEEFRKEASKEFHHNFNYESKGSELSGHWYQLLFSRCTLLKDGKVKATLNFIV